MLRRCILRADHAFFALAALCAIAAAAAQGGRFNGRLDLLSHFAPIWLLGSVVALVWALAVSSAPIKWPLAVLSLAGVLAALCLIVPELTRPIRPNVPETYGRRLKLIQFNVWDENHDLGRAMDWIVSEHPDVVLVQETDMAANQEMAHRGFTFVRTMGHTAIFARQSQIGPPCMVPPHLWKLLPTFTRATFPFGDSAFSVISIHMDRHAGDGNASEIKALSELVAQYPASTLIVGGDFNMTPWSFAMHRLDSALPLERRDRALPSWPARLPLGRGEPPLLPILPIDHLYAGSAWRTVSVARGPRLGSDHYPLVVTLAMSPDAR